MSTAYPKILHIGDKPIEELYDGDVEITEKLDGSQFGFGFVNGQLVCRSKGRELDLDNPDKLFEPAVNHVKSLVPVLSHLTQNVFFYAETLSKPRHSTLAYEKVPKNNIALFGAMRDDKTMLTYGEMVLIANLLDIDIVPLLYEGKSSPEHTLSLMDTMSFLGGQKIEGVVVKRYVDWMFLGRILVPVMAGKYVTEAFKEVHQKDWSKLNTGKGKFESLKDKYRSEARWNKAIQHLKDNGNFEGTVRDIGNLLKEVQRDLKEEEIDNIKDDLFKIFGDDILRYATSGFVEFYKQKIAMGDFQNE